MSNDTASQCAAGSGGPSLNWFIASVVVEDIQTDERARVAKYKGHSLCTIFSQ